jgi:hypothetical protein
MPRCYRCVTLAAFGWLILAASPQPTPAAKAQESSTDRRVGDALTNIAATYNQQAKRSERAPQRPLCGPGKYESNDDLCAQWKAADSAQFAAWLTGISLVTVAIALGLTIQSNLIARDTARRQLRAYVGLDAITAIPVVNLDGDQVWKIQATWRNAGATPALKLRGPSFRAKRA